MIVSQRYKNHIPVTANTGLLPILTVTVCVGGHFNIPRESIQIKTVEGKEDQINQGRELIDKGPCEFASPHPTRLK